MHRFSWYYSEDHYNKQKKKKKKMFRSPSAWDIICNYVYLYANCFTLICVFINKVPIMLFIGD